MRYITYSY